MAALSVALRNWIETCTVYKKRRQRSLSNLATRANTTAMAKSWILAYAASLEGQRDPCGGCISYLQQWYSSCCLNKGLLTSLWGTSATALIYLLIDFILISSLAPLPHMCSRLRNDLGGKTTWTHTHSGASLAVYIPHLQESRCIYFFVLTTVSWNVCLTSKRK